MLRLFGGASAAGASILLFCVAFIPPALGLVGAAVGYELSASGWMAGLGLAGGLLAGLLFVRDFLRWRVRPATVLVMACLIGLFAMAYR